MPWVALIYRHCTQDCMVNVWDIASQRGATEYKLVLREGYARVVVDVIECPGVVGTDIGTISQGTQLQYFLFFM